jgi:hypothetical protein
LEIGSELLVLGLVEGNVCVIEFRLLGPGGLSSHKISDEAQGGVFVQREQIGLNLASAHQVDTGQENAVNVEKRFDASGRLLQE